jgi:hypothetical protein
MITMAASSIHSQTSDELVELVGVGEMLGGVDGATVVGATVVGATVVGGTVVGGTVVGTVVGGAVGEVLLLGRVGTVMLGAALRIALLMLLAAPQPTASNPTARAAASRTTVLVKRRIPAFPSARCAMETTVASRSPP